MSAETLFSIQSVSFKQYEQQIKYVRKQVFIDECQIPENLEWDDRDDDATFTIAIVENKCIATGRLLNNGHIGRVAVLPEYRHHGIGTAIITSLISIAKEQRYKTIYLSSQQSAIPFYENMGFKCEGKPFLAANIPHQLMYKVLV